MKFSAILPYPIMRFYCTFKFMKMKDIDKNFKLSNARLISDAKTLVSNFWNVLKFSTKHI